MKVLFDYNLPYKLRSAMAGSSSHQILSTGYMGWADLKNGELLHTAESNGFEVFVTSDKSLKAEQNLTGRKLAIIVLTANNWPIVKAYIPTILEAIDRVPSGSFETVDCGRFSRRRIR